VTVRVPGTSANLGPGFDSMALALALYDEVTVQATPDAGGLRVDVEGEGAATVPRDEGHLVVRTIRAGLEQAGVPQPGLVVRCRNRLPHGRGLGSSAAAVVAGLVAARGLLEDPAALDDAAVFALATAAEGHPDNAAGALFGSFVVAWLDASSHAPRHVRLAVDPRVRVVVCVPDEQLPTSSARRMLPSRIPHADAAFTAARAALLVEALTRRPDLLLEATQERLHQAQRAPAMPRTERLLARLRALGAPAVISGAGPSVLVLCDSPGQVHEVVSAAAGWHVLTPDVDTLGAHLITESR
jgi:homoserine kinase